MDVQEQVVKEMLMDRGYNNVYSNNAFEDNAVHYQHLTGVNQDDEECHAFWLVADKLGINVLRTIQSYFKKQPDLIIICRLGSTPFTERKMSESSSSKDISVFRNCEINRNVTKHILVPKHTKCTQEEVQNLLKTHKLETVHQLPLMYTTDAIAKYYNFKEGNVIRINRLNGKNMQTYYRLVVNAAL